METPTKEDLSKQEDVTTSDFVKAAVFMTFLTLASIFVVWKFHVGEDFRHIVSGGIIIVVFARMITRLISDQPDLVVAVCLGNTTLSCVFAYSIETLATKQTPPPFGDVLVAAFMLYLVIASVRMTSLAMNRAVPVLVTQQLIFGASLYGLYHLI